VEHSHGFLGFSSSTEFDEGETTGFARELVHHQIHPSDHPCLGKIFLQVFFHGLVREVANKESRLIHN
jgi:hypothetical protein